MTGKTTAALMGGALFVMAATALTTTAARAQEGGTGSLKGLSLSSGLPIQIESDKLEVFDAENKAKFSGNVNVSQGPTTMRTGQMIVFYKRDSKDGPTNPATGSGAIDHMKVSGGVYIRSNDQVATGEQGTFDMKTEELVLEGKEVTLSQGSNILVGCKLTVKMKSGQATVDGCRRVQVLIDPKQKPAGQ